MEIYNIENLSFTYPAKNKKALDNVNLRIKSGEFITVCGLSGSGKTTLLRLLKTATSPSGKCEGAVFFCGNRLDETDLKKQAADIGFVMQNPDSQTVTNVVWHELSFGLENLGVDSDEIRRRASEISAFFGIEKLFHKKISELSGGQKQLVNLASAMILRPRVLILDEPTGQLDPIAADNFLETVYKINREIGTTVILSEHRLEKAFTMSDRVIVVDNGKIAIDAKPTEVCRILKTLNHRMYKALPIPAEIFGILEPDSDNYPLTVAEGRKRLYEYSETHALDESLIEKSPSKENDKKKTKVLEAENLYFRYEKNLPDTVCDLSLTVYRGELLAVIGGNGSGKTTALSLLSGMKKAYSGNVYIHGEKISSFGASLYGKIIGVMPQNPAELFAKNTSYEELFGLTDEKKTLRERNERIREVVEICELEEVSESHPYDLSGGEQQRLALAMLLLKKPEILLLDEPTKGVDGVLKHKILKILKKLTENGVTVIMISHDLELCAEYADRCAVFFDGGIISVGSPREIFGGNSFYTTATSRMTRGIVKNAITVKDIVAAAGIKNIDDLYNDDDGNIDIPFTPPNCMSEKQKKRSRPSLFRLAAGGAFALLSIAAFFLKDAVLPNTQYSDYTAYGIILVFAFLSAACFFPQRKIYTGFPNKAVKGTAFSKRTVFAGILILLIIPLTVFFGIYFLDDRKYYFISLLIILETLLPFFAVFENRKPQAKELVIISVLCGIAVAGRCAFFAVPEFKPVVAVVIVAGISFGGEAGFLVGSMTAFVSNFFFGHGQWTPWQMFAFGIIGFISGLLFGKEILPKTKISLSVYGFLSALIIYGGIMNAATVLMRTTAPNLKMFLAAAAIGLPMDFIHASATAFFLWFIAEPMLEKLERVKIKYGILN